jgi:hypothetical protein
MEKLMLELKINFDEEKNHICFIQYDMVWFCFQILVKKIIM